MVKYDKDAVKESLSIENIFDIVQEWGGEPEYTDFGLLARTICHNEPGSGRRKLYYYENTKLFSCYTGCGETFDIFELIIKVRKIQEGIEFELFQAVRYIASKFNILGAQLEESDGHSEDTDYLNDWLYLNNCERLRDLTVEKRHIQLKEYDGTILDKFYYPKILSWEAEGISDSIIKRNRIGYYPGNEQITIPHYDQNNRFIGLRGRALGKEQAIMYGKYIPLRVNKMLYNHPLGFNLYNLNNSKNNIAILKKAIVFEGEKSALLYQSYFDYDISVACCGSSLSAYQMQLLMDCGAEEVIIAFDRQFQEIGDKEFTLLKKNLCRLGAKYNRYLTVSCIFDKGMTLEYKSSPIDEGKDKFLSLLDSRILL